MRCLYAQPRPTVTSWRNPHKDHTSAPAHLQPRSAPPNNHFIEKRKHKHDACVRTLHVGNANDMFHACFSLRGFMDTSASRKCLLTGEPSLRCTNNLVMVDLSRRNSWAMSEGAMSSSSCHIFAKRISSCTSFRYGLRCGRRSLERRRPRGMAGRSGSAGKNEDDTVHKWAPCASPQRGIFVLANVRMHKKTHHLNG